MQRVSPEALKTEASPVLRAQLAEDRVKKLFPVQFDEVDPWAASEPTKGALVRLEKGDLFVVTYGMATHTLEISLPKVKDVRSVVTRILEEAPIEPADIEWKTSALNPPGKPSLRGIASSSPSRRIAKKKAAKTGIATKRRPAAKRHRTG
jgi:hypothetical protein